MNHGLASAVAITFGLGIALPASAQDLASQIVGVWKLQKVDRCKAGTAECVAFYAEKPSGYVVFTKSGVFLSQGYAARLSAGGDLNS